MALSYGYDISRPATNAQDAIQWTYFAYLAAVKEQDGATMGFGRADAFFDVYIQRDLEAGLISEEDAQELIDHLVMKLRLVRHLRTPECTTLFGGDPTGVAAVLGGIDSRGNSMVTKTSFRILQTLNNLGMQYLFPWIIPGRIIVSIVVEVGPVLAFPIPRRNNISIQPHCWFVLHHKSKKTTGCVPCFIQPWFCQSCAFHLIPYS